MKPKIYEAMFLLDNREVKKDAAALDQRIAGILEKNGAKVIVSRRWDERKLAYEIRRQKRATYQLAYFEAPPDAITPIRRELYLTEAVLRVLFLLVESVPPAAFEAPPPPRTEEEAGGGEEGAGAGAAAAPAAVRAAAPEEVKA